MNLDMTYMRFKVIVSEPYDLDPKIKSNILKHNLIYQVTYNFNQLRYANTVMKNTIAHTVMLRISTRALIQFSKPGMGSYSRVGAYLRQRCGGTYSIIVCLGWALIQGMR